MFERQFIPMLNSVSPNEIKGFGEFHLSYNPSSHDYGSDTTALVLKGSVFLILNGDHKKPLSNRVDLEGFQGAFNYFLENIDKVNHLGEHKQASGLCDKDPFNIGKQALEFLGQDNITKLRLAITNSK